MGKIHVPETNDAAIAAGFSLIATETDDRRRRFVVHVDDPCPQCADHFPDDPIVPAIGLVDLVATLLADDPSGATAVRIDELKLRRPVRPGDRLVVRVDAADRDGTRFDILRDDRTAVAGRLALVDPGKDDDGRED